MLARAEENVRHEDTSSRNRQLGHFAIAAALFAPLCLALSMRPDPRGYGTHEQLGLPPCGFRLFTGMPCPGCGGTTAFVLAAHGHLLQALRVHVAGAVAAAICVVAGVTEVLLGLRLLRRAGLWRYAWLSVLLAAFALQLSIWCWQTGSTLLRAAGR